MENFDIHRFFKVLSNSKLYIIGILLLFLTMGYFYSFYYMSPLYQSSATLVLVQNDDSTTTEESITQKDITLNQNLLSTYTKIAKSDKVLSQVIKNLGLSSSVQQLSNFVNVQAVNNTEVFKISVTNKDSMLAANITNELLNVFSNEVKNLYHMNNVYAMDKAEPSSTPYNINHTKDMSIFGILGAVVSMGLVLAIYLLDTTIKSEQDIEEYAEMNVLSTIPMYQDDKNKMTTELIVNEQPKSPIAECFKTFRTNIMFSIKNKELSTILVTSGYMSEGKSFVSSNLAVTFAQSGKRVILIDTDMRKGRQHKIFEVSSKPGLSNCLFAIGTDGAKVNINEYIQETAIQNLHIMTSGDVPPNPSELLSSLTMRNFLQTLNTQYDIVICDGTPCMLVSDSIILSKIVDTTVIVTANRITKLDTLLKIKRSIKMVGGNIGGTVINKMNVNTKAYQNQYYYGTHNETDSNIEFEVSNTNSLLHQELHLTDLVTEESKEVAPILHEDMAIIYNNATLENANSMFANSLLGVKSEVAQIKELYKNLMQTALDSSIKKDTTSFTIIEELNMMKELYQSTIQEQNKQREYLNTTISNIEKTDHADIILQELNTMMEEQTKQIEFLNTQMASMQTTEPSELYENELVAIKNLYLIHAEEQNRQMQTFTTKIASMQPSDNSEIMQELSNIQEVYQQAMKNQEDQIHLLQQEITNKESVNSSNLVKEFDSIKEIYHDAIVKQAEQMDAIEHKISTIEIPDNTNIMDELSNIQNAYHTTIEKQTQQMIALQNKITAIEELEPATIQKEFNVIKEMYQDTVEKQAEQIDILNDKIANLQITDNSNVILSELDGIKDLYQYTIDKQLEQTNALEDKMTEIKLSDHSDIVIEELQNVQQLYHMNMQKQEEQISALQDKIASLQMTDYSDIVMKELQNVQQLYYTNMHKQEEQIGTLQDKIANLQMTDNSNIILNELDSIKDLYQSAIDKQLEQINALENKITKMELSDHSNIVIEELQNVQQLYHMNMRKQEKQIDALQDTIANIQITDHSDRIIEELDSMKKMVDANREKQEEQINSLNRKVVDVETNANSNELLIEISKIYRQLESINQRFDILEEKAKQNESFLSPVAKTQHSDMLKERKLIDINKLNAKVIQIQDYIEKQPIEIPINIQPMESSSIKKNKLVLDGQLHITDCVEETDLKEQSTQINYVVDYDTVERKQKRGFNLFKAKDKKIEEPIEEPIVFVSQILSKTNFENVG